MSRADPTKQRQVRLPDRVWSALQSVAVREGLKYGKLPSRAEAVKWLLERDAERVILADTSTLRSPPPD